MKIKVILGSTRPGRAGEKVAKWVMDTAKQSPEVDYELVDLADFELPFFNEAVSPRFNQERRPSGDVARWLTVMAEADGYVFITPEYNHSLPAVLKNALDYLDYQAVKKAAAIVSYGTVGGARAAMHLKEILSENKLAVVPEAVALAQFGSLSDDGVLPEELRTKPYGPQTMLTSVLSELIWWTDALKVARQSQSLGKAGS